MLKIEIKRGYATPAHELLFALAQMDFSNTESGIMLSAIPYMYGAPNPKLKSALIQVETGPWLASQRDRSNAYKTIKRLVIRRVLTATSKGRYILNTRYGEWLDKNGRPVFTEATQGTPGPSPALQNLTRMMAIRPFWRDTEAGQGPRATPVDNSPAGEADEVAQPQPEPPEMGLHNPNDCGDTTPQMGLHNPNDCGSTTPQMGLHNPNEPEQGRQQGRSGALRDSRSKQEREKAAAKGIPPTLLAFARSVCLLGDEDIADVRSIAAQIGNIEALTLALEKFAATSNRPGNPGGFIRTLTEKAHQGERITLPANARTFNQFAAHHEAKQRLRAAMNGETAPQSTSRPAAAPPTERNSIAEAAEAAENAGVAGASEIKHLAQSEQQRQSTRTRTRDQLADAFASRSANMQAAALDEITRAKMPLHRSTCAAIREWQQTGRPWREAAPEIADLLAQAESLARKNLDPVVETVAIRTP